MKCHEGSSPGLMKCSAASRTTNVAAATNDRRAAVDETAAPRVVPGSANGFAIFAESAPVVRRGSLLPAPDREGISLKLVDVIKSIAHVVVEATLYLRPLLPCEGAFLSDGVDALELLPVLL